MPTILTIGNSFAGNATDFLAPMCRSVAGAELSVGRANLGGCSLEKHWNLHQQCEALADVKPYEYVVDGRLVRSASLIEILRDRTWDFITLQQASRLSWQADSFQPWGDRLAGLIRQHSPRSRIVVYQTWAYQSDAPELAQWGITQEVMFRHLEANYRALASRLGGPVIPVGHAFQKARKRLPYRQDPNYDFAAPKPRELPDQTNSLHAGYRWDTGNTPSGKAELLCDARHCNHAGRYLGACVWFELFTGIPASASPFTPPDIQSGMLPILQQAAHEAVEESGGPL